MPMPTSVAGPWPPARKMLHCKPVYPTVAVVAINPRTLRGPWVAGFALDWHTLRSVPIGYNQFGHMQFDTTRPPVGQLLYDLKYGAKTVEQKQQIANELAETAAHFVRQTWRLAIDGIVPVPPSNARALQPVAVVAEALAGRLGVPVCTTCVAKVKQTPQLKDLKDYDKRKEALKDAFTVVPELTQGKKLLLFDDLFGSGATVGAHRGSAQAARSCQSCLPSDADDEIGAS